MPVSKPADEPMVAMEGLLLVQMPPGLASVSVVVAATQSAVEPDGAGGPGLTVMVRVAKHPEGNE